MIFKEVEGNLKSEKNTFLICLATSRVPPLKGMGRHKRRVLSVHELWRDQSKRDGLCYWKIKPMTRVNLEWTSTGRSVLTNFLQHRPIAIQDVKIRVLFTARLPPLP